MARSRFNIYRDAHKGLRLLLTELTARVDRTDFHAVDEVLRLREEMAVTLKLLRAHTHYENAFLGPLMQLYCPELLATVRAEHVEEEGRLAELSQLLNEVDPHRSDVAQRGHAFSLHLGMVVGELFQHMSREEQQVLPALWQKLSDKTLQTVNESLLASIPYVDRAIWLKTLLRALNRPERLVLLSRMRATMPRHAFDSTIDTVRAELRDVHDTLASDLLLLESTAA